MLVKLPNQPRQRVVRYQDSRSSRSLSSIMRTGFLASPHAPWISFSFSTGKPAFCARPVNPPPGPISSETARRD